MKDLRGKILRIGLVSAAFITVLGLAGCMYTSNAATAAAASSYGNAVHPGDQTAGSSISSGNTSTVASAAVSAPRRSKQVQLAAATSGEAETGGNVGTTPNNRLNVFGEIGGVEQGGSKPAGKSGFEQHTYIDEGYDSDVTIDPTGKWMLFTSTRNTEHPEIYSQRVDGMSVIQLTNDDADYAYPAFSPDGKQITFCSTRSGSWDIYIMDADGKNVQQLTSGGQQHVHPSFSPDQSRVVYSSLGSKSDQWELWTIDLSSGEKRQIGFGLFPTWSPSKDGDKIAFQRARQRGGRWFSLWTLDLVDGEARRVTEVAASSNAAIVCPTWNSDGKQLAFATISEPSDSAGNKPNGQQDIWTINSDGTNRHRLTDGVGMNLYPCWSPDNNVYFVSDRTGTECIWSTHSDGVISRFAASTNPSNPTPGTAVGSTQEP